MYDFSRLFVVNNGVVDGMSDSNRTSFLICLKDDRLTIKQKSGRFIFDFELYTAFGRFIQEYESEFGEKMAFYRRNNYYRFCYRQGSSGCQDIFIEIDSGDGFPERKFIIHYTSYGKTAGCSCYVYDFLDFCVAAGILGVEDDYYSVPAEEPIDYELMSVKPRLTEYEDGWTSPWKHASKVVRLTTCREKPVEETEEKEEE